MTIKPIGYKPVVATDNSIGVSSDVSTNVSVEASANLSGVVSNVTSVTINTSVNIAEQSVNITDSSTSGTLGIANVVVKGDNTSLVVENASSVVPFEPGLFKYIEEAVYVSELFSSESGTEALSFDSFSVSDTISFLIDSTIVDTSSVTHDIHFEVSTQSQDNAILSEIVSKTIGLSLASNIHVSEQFETLNAIPGYFFDNFLFNEYLSLSYGANYTDTVSYAEIFALSINKALLETTSLSETLTTVYDKNLVDTISLAESLSAIADRISSSQDLLILNEQLSKAVSSNYSENASLSEAISLNSSFNRVFVDSTVLNSIVYLTPGKDIVEMTSSSEEVTLDLQDYVDSDYFETQDYVTTRTTINS